MKYSEHCLPADEARDNLYCPLTYPDLKNIRCCMGPTCAAWRWHEEEVDEPGWKEAVQEAKEKGIGYKEAPTYVNEHRTEFGLPEKPWRGYCGMGGKPEC